MTTPVDLDWAWPHPTLSSSGPPADVELWVDPTDNLGVLRQVQALHDPSAGRVVVSPTPASRSGLTLITDVLGALGVEWRLRLGNPQTTPSTTRSSGWPPPGFGNCMSCGPIASLPSGGGVCADWSAPTRSAWS